METNVQAAPSSTQRPPHIDFPDFPITAKDMVVDVGCGEGLVCAYAGSQGADVVGLDIEPSLIERANAAMRDVPARSYRGIVTDADPIPLPDACATVVIATEVMEHVDDPGRFLAELARIGKPGARYLISVPDPASESVLRVVAPRWFWEKPIHINVFEHHELAALCASAGLQIEARHASGFYWTMWWAFRLSLGMGHPYEPAPPSPLLGAWEETMRALMETPNGMKLLGAFDSHLPKSQIVIARKSGASASSFGGPTWAGRRMKRALRDGALQLGRFDLRWQIRRAKPGA